MQLGRTSSQPTRTDRTSDGSLRGGRPAVRHVAALISQEYNLYTNGVCEAGYETNDISGLDGGFPYADSASEARQSPDDWIDSPGAELSSAQWLRQTGSFSTFLMFQPKPYDTSIYVPMYNVQWSWFGSATNGPPWGKKSGSPSCPQPSPPPSEGFPSWTHTIAGTDSSRESMHRTNCFNEN